MSLQMYISIFISLLFLILLGFLFAVKIRAGKSIGKIKSLEAVLFLIIGIICLGSSVYCLLLPESDGHAFIAGPMFTLSLYFIGYSRIYENSLTEKGIIVLNNFPVLLKWDEIKRFAVNGNKIYFEKSNGYVSIAVNKQCIEDLEKIISDRVECKPTVDAWGN